MNRAAIHVVVNIIDGIPVSVVRRKAKRIIVRVKPDGEIILTIPFWRATLAEGAVFLASKWEWAFSTREHVLAHPAPPVREFTPMEVAELQTTRQRGGLLAQDAELARQTAQRRAFHSSSFNQKAFP